MYIYMNKEVFNAGIFTYRIIAEESHERVSNKKSGICYSKKFIGFLILNVLVAYIVVIYLATKDPDDNGDQKTTTIVAPGEARGTDEVHVNTGVVVSDNVACSTIGRSETSCNVAMLLNLSAW